MYASVVEKFGVRPWQVEVSSERLDSMRERATAFCTTVVTGKGSFEPPSCAPPH